MRRRDFITLFGGAIAGHAWCLPASAQQAAGVRLVGVLMDYAASDQTAQSLLTAFRGTLAKLGWQEGGNLRIEVRWSAGSADKVRTFAKELIDLRPDAILGRGTPETFALSRETQTIPIVFAAVSDPIGSGFAASLTHPGRNMTGFTNVESTVGSKWVELLKGDRPPYYPRRAPVQSGNSRAVSILSAFDSSGRTVLGRKGQYGSDSRQG